MSIDEDLERKRHMLYYNQLIQSDRRAKLKKQKTKRKKRKLIVALQEKKLTSKIICLFLMNMNGWHIYFTLLLFHM